MMKWPAITLLTLTADRPRAFALCEQWTKRMCEHYEGEVQIIVSDGGESKVDCHLGQEHILVKHETDKHQNFLANLCASLPHIKHNWLAFIEDDDYYSARYLKEMVCHMLREDAPIAGECHAKYYNVMYRSYWVHDNTGHASLCQTVIRDSMLDTMRKLAFTIPDAYLDMPLWDAAKASGIKRHLFWDENLALGIKGFPGKVGIGSGHKKPDSYYRADRKNRLLREWIGHEDAQVYITLRCNEWRARYAVGECSLEELQNGVNE